jgi:predicted Zn-dependent protease
VSGFILVVAVLAALAASAPPARAIMLVTRADEVKIGKQVEAQSIKDYGGLVNDRAMSERVARVGKKVAAVSPRQDVTYTYKVLNSNVINAFSAPGGPVMITKKLVQMLTTDDELAFVLGHETGHVAAEHGRKAINQAIIAQGIAAILLGKAGDTVQTGVNVTYTLYTRGYSRDQEYQADTYGVQLMTKAGYNPEAAVKALAKLGLNKSKGINKYFATHPDTPDRIDRVALLAGISKEREAALIKSVQTP